MQASVMYDTDVRTIAIEVSGVPDVDGAEKWLTVPRMFRPDRVLINIVNGAAKSIKISGGLVRKGGSTSFGARVMKTWHSEPTGFHADQLVFDAPEWVRTLWDEAPTGVTSWPSFEKTQS